MRPLLCTSSEKDWGTFRERLEKYKTEILKTCGVVFKIKNKKKSSFLS